MLGVWEAGRFIDISMTLQDAARVGARQAAGGVSGGTNVTFAMVQTTVQNYLQAAGFPSAAPHDAQVTLTNLEQRRLDGTLAGAAAGSVQRDGDHSPPGPLSTA